MTATSPTSPAAPAPFADPSLAPGDEYDRSMSDRGLTHVALTVRDIGQSIAFYREFGGFDVVHERHDDDTGSAVVWLSDMTRPFVVVLIQNDEPIHPLAGSNHLGVGLRSRGAVDDVADRARAEGRLELGPTDSGHPVGYWAILRDPDGHQLEVSHGQDVGLTIERCRTTS
jgi:catechol 2,3-dioxygenase-like lactoylglutathione lyase family enzyme